MTYGSLESGIIAYMRSTGASMVCNEREDLDKSIATLIRDKKLQREYYEQAIYMTNKNHNLQSSSETSLRVILKAIKNMERTQKQECSYE